MFAFISNFKLKYTEIQQEPTHKSHLCQTFGQPAASWLSVGYMWMAGFVLCSPVQKVKEIWQL